MKLDIVVARYKESISWLDHLLDSDFDISTHVYNKHEGENLLPNVGRESHTYIHHIINNYHEIKDTIFLQGNPFDYDHEFPKNSIRKFILDYFKNSKTVDFFAFNSNTSFVDKNGYPTKRVPLPIGAFYEKIFGDKSSPEIFEFNPGACFFASKRSIQNIQLEKYQIMLELLSHSQDPVEAYCIERMWKSMFNGFDDKKRIKEFCKSQDGKLLAGFPQNYPEFCSVGDEVKTLHHNLMGKTYKRRV